MNILVLTSTYPKFAGDSTAPFIASITEHVAALGHTVHVVLPEHRELRRENVEGTIHFHPYRYSPRRSWTPWGYAQSLEGGVKLRRALYALAPSVLVSARRTCSALAARESFDVIHAHWVVPNGTIAASIGARSAIPLVVSLHGSDMSVSERSRWMASLARRAFAQAAAVTAPSEDLLARARALGASGHFEVIPYGADLDAFDPAPEVAAQVRRRLGLGADEIVVLGVGRFVRMKGFDYLIQAVSQAAESAPEIRLVLVGDGDLRSELEEQVGAKGLRDRVIFTGMSAHEDIANYFGAADIVVVPSIHHSGHVDGLPNVALEAMAAERPLIATRVGGLPELVQDGVSGLLVDERDPQAIAQAIVRLAGDQDLRRKMGEQGRTLVGSRLSWDQVAHRFVDVYERVSS